MPGYGDSPYGSGPFGSGELVEFDLTGASAITYQSVVLTFSNPIADLPITVSNGSYSISPALPVFAVVYDPTYPNQVTLYTVSQVQGAVYTVTAANALLDVYGQSLVLDTASFTGIGVVIPPTPVNLTATSLCAGQAIQLTWSMP